MTNLCPARHEVFKRTVKFGIVTEDQTDIVQRYKAWRPPGCD